jgi:hypothetical protein
MFNFNFFKSAHAEEPTEGNWNANTVTMQPTSPAAPSSNQNIVTEQPVCEPCIAHGNIPKSQTNIVQSTQEQMQLRGGGGGGICCGVYVPQSRKYKAGN